MAKETAPLAKCPTCRKKVGRKDSTFYPFCNERCQLQDLGKWLDNGYSIPGSFADGERETLPDENEEGW